MRRCYICKTFKPDEEFHKEKRRKDGIGSRCKKCGIERTREYKRAHPRDILGHVLKLALKRLPTQNPVTLDELVALWRAQNGKCALSGLEMTWGKGTILPTSMSLDRIDSTKGYSLVNLRLVCHSINTMRKSMSDAEVLEMAKAIVHHLEKKKAIAA